MKILVIGSVNLDYRLKVHELPSPGITTRGETDRIEVGGKGANQARAAQRFGFDVHLVGSVGKDSAGTLVHDTLIEEGITVQLFQSARRTGYVFIAIDPSGRNMLALDPGANQALPVDRAIEVLQKFDGPVLLQMELTAEVLEHILKVSDPRRHRLYVDGGPIMISAFQLLRQTVVFSPNLGELGKIFGRPIQNSDDLIQAVGVLKDLGVKVPVIKMGEYGAAYRDGQSVIWVPAWHVDPVDTTGAGDCFMGALAYSLEHSMPLSEAIVMANAAAAISTTKMGITTSFPTLEQTLHFMRENQAPVPRQLQVGEKMPLGGKSR